MNTNTRLHLAAFLWLSTTYAAAFGLDRLFAYLREGTSAALFTPSVQFWSWSLDNLVIAGGVLVFYEWAVPHLERWALWLVLVLGLLVNFIPVFYLLIHSSLAQLLMPFMTIRPVLSSVGAFSAAAAVLGLRSK
jgi:hydrogenase/urease accessory protein HupE